MTAPTDGEWMSAYEALQFLLSLNIHYADAVSTIRTRAHTGLIKVRAKLFIFHDKQQTDAEVPRAVLVGTGRRSARPQLEGW